MTVFFYVHNVQKIIMRVKMDLIKNDETLDDLQIGNIYVIQKKDSFRFGVDAVLLANYAKIKKNSVVVDLCSGTGIIPFILAGKTDAECITGVEIQEEMVEMACRSVEYNDLEDKVKFVHGDLKNINVLKNLPKADIVTVNPPYKLEKSGIISTNDKTAISRHEICCNLEDVIKASKFILKDNGKLFMVHRPERIADIFCLMRKHKIEPKSVKLVYPNTKKPPNIVLVEGCKGGGAFLKWESPLYVHKEDGGYTEEIEKIYGRIK